MNNTHPAAGRRVERVRHTLKARRITARSVARISPHFVRVRFGGDDLHDFVSASFDDHLKLMLPPAAGEPLVLPQIGPEGLSQPAGSVRPLMRDYTPRSFDNGQGTLDIEFALHGDGPAAAWAAQAAPGQQLGIGGPRGSLLIPMDYDLHLLVGDETALPAIARRLEELPAGARAIAIIETGDRADQRELVTRAQAEVQWLQRGRGTDLAAAVQRLVLPAGEAYAWAAGESHAIAAVRRVLVEQHGLDKDHIRAAAYWKLGDPGHHENL